LLVIAQKWTGLYTVQFSFIRLAIMLSCSLPAARLSVEIYITPFMQLYLEQ